MAHVEFRYEYLSEALQDVAEVTRQRIQIANVDGRNALPLLLGKVHRSEDRAISTTPADNQQIAGVGSVDRLLRDVAGNAGDLGGTQVDHPLVVFRVVAHVASDILLLQAADAVFQAGRAGNGPGAGQFLVAQIGQESVTFGIAHGRVVDLDPRQGLGVRNQPWLSAAGQVSIGQEHHRGHIPHGDAERLLNHHEAIGRGRRRNDRDRAFAIATEQGLEQVRLLRLGRQSGARPATLHVDDHER